VSVQVVVALAILIAVVTIVFAGNVWRTQRHSVTGQGKMVVQTWHRALLWTVVGISVLLPIGVVLMSLMLF